MTDMENVDNPQQSKLGPEARLQEADASSRWPWGELGDVRHGFGQDHLPSTTHRFHIAAA